MLSDRHLFLHSTCRVSAAEGVLRPANFGKRIAVGIAGGDADVRADFVANVAPQKRIRPLLQSEQAGHGRLVPRPRGGDFLNPRGKLPIVRLDAGGKLRVRRRVLVSAAVVDEA